MTSVTLRRTLVTLALAAVLAAMAGCSSDDDAGPTDPDPEPTADTLTLGATADTYIDDDDTNASPGQELRLHTGPTRRAFLRFDLSALPADAVVTGAELRLTQDASQDASSAADLVVRLTTDDEWDEDAASADDPPGAGRLWLTGVSVPALSSGQRTVIVASDEFRNQAGLDVEFSTGLFSLQLSSDSDLAFFSAEAADPDQRPALVLTYADGMRANLNTVAEAWTHGAYPDSNFADTEVLNVERSNCFTYLKFDLSSLPAGAKVQLSRLRLTAQNGYAYGGDGNVYTYRVADDAWTADGITHDNAPNTTGDHCGYWWLWYDYTPRDATGTNTSSLLSPLVQQELDGDGTLSVRLNSPGYLTIYYRSDAENPDFRPHLDVVYTVGD